MTLFFMLFRIIDLQEICAQVIKVLSLIKKGDIFTLTSAGSATMDQSVDIFHLDKVDIPAHFQSLSFSNIADLAICELSPPSSADLETKSTADALSAAPPAPIYQSQVQAAGLTSSSVKYEKLGSYDETDASSTGRLFCFFFISICYEWQDR